MSGSEDGSLASYNDLLVEQYLEEIQQQDEGGGGGAPDRRHPPTASKKKSSKRSPYEKPVVQRSRAATAGKRRGRVTMPDFIEKALESDSDSWSDEEPTTQVQLVSPRAHKSESPRGKERNRSGHSSERKTDQSASPRPRSKRAHNYMKVPQMFKIRVYRNGDRETSATIVAGNLNELLNGATDRLRLGSAARKLFVKGGRQVKTFDEVVQLEPNDSDSPYPQLYVSCGEPYRNPFRTINSDVALKRSATWNMTGVQLEDDEKRGKTKVHITQRLREMSATTKRRVLVLRNGLGHSSCEVLTPPDDFIEFLDLSSRALDLGAAASKAFTVRGKLVTSLDDAPVVDKLVYPASGSGQVLGPLWISRGDGFSGIGARDYLTHAIKGVREKLSSLKYTQAQIELAMDSTKAKDVTMKELLSLGEDELYEKSTEVEDEIESTKAVLKKLKSNLDHIQPIINEEASKGSLHRMSHIAPLTEGSRLHSKEGLRVVVHENGQEAGGVQVLFNMKEAMRGYTGPDQLMKRFLDHCIASRGELRKPRQTPFALKARKLFDESGQEVTDVQKIENDQNLWISFGEPFIPFTVPCVQLNLDRAHCARVVSAQGSRQLVYKTPLVQKDLPAGRDQAKNYVGYEGWTVEGYKEKELRPAENAFHGHEVTTHSNNQIAPTASFLQCKDEAQFVLYGQVSVSAKKPIGHCDVWPQKAQLWVIRQDGHICSKAFPQLCLGLSEQKAKSPYESSDDAVLVEVQKLSPGRSSQTWIFTNDGFIKSGTDANLVLTAVEEREGSEEESIASGLIACPKLPRKSPNADMQRFGLKQEGFSTMGEWKKCSGVANPDWNKRALSWPVDENGDLNEEYKWPMVGILVARAPPFSAPKTPKAVVPLRLNVLANGLGDKSRSVAVMAPDISQLDKEKLHCGDMTVRELEMQQFLHNCTAALRLPSAARRLFDERGNEIFSLEGVPRDTFVHVTQGEGWVDPGSASGQDIHYTAKLAADLRSIETFLTLRNPQYLSLQAEDLKEGALIRIYVTSLEEFQREEIKRVPTPTPPPPPEPTMEEILADKPARVRTAYRLSVLDRGLQADSWKGHCRECKDTMTCTIHAHELPPPPPPPPVVEPLVNHTPNYWKQSFDYKPGGFILSRWNPKLAMSVNPFGRACLARFDANDASQKWVLNQDRRLHIRNSPERVLSVFSPLVRPGDERRPDIYEGCELVMQPAVVATYGAAHQRFSFDAHLGIFDAFTTCVLDKEVTAANRAGVCTNALNGCSPIQQPTFVLTLEGGKKHQLCFSCARVVRGYDKYSVEKAPKNVKFACSLQPGTQISRALVGSFRAVFGKIDLSTNNAEQQESVWREKLISVQKQAVAIADKPFQAYIRPRIIRANVRKNGRGYLDSPVLVSGDSLHALMVAGQNALRFNSAVRLLFTRDGTSIVSLEQFEQEAVDQFAAQQGKYVMRPEQDTLNPKQIDNTAADPVPNGDGDQENLSIESGSTEIIQKSGFTSPAQKLSIARPGAPEPSANLLQNADFEDQNASSSPQFWKPMEGAKLECIYDQELDTSCCKVTPVKSRAGMSQDVSGSISFNRRFKLSVHIKLVDAEELGVTSEEPVTIKCVVACRKTRAARPVSLPVFSIRLDSDEWHEASGFVNVPRSTSDTVADAQLVFSFVNGQRSAFCIARPELAEDMPTGLDVLGENLFRNGDLDIWNGRYEPRYWLAANQSTTLTQQHDCSCKMQSVKWDAAFFYDVTHSVQRENLYKFEFECKSLDSDDNTRVKSFLVYKKTDERELQVPIAENQSVGEEWVKMCGRISLPQSSSADELIEYCALRVESSNSLLFRSPFFTTETAKQKPPEKASEQASEETELSESGCEQQDPLEAGEPELQPVQIKDLDVESILKTPMDLWLSTGAAFVPPSEVIEKEELRQQINENKRPTGVVLDLEKHKLRMMKARRVQSCKGGTLLPTSDPSQPVIVDNSCTVPSAKERHVQEKVQHLSETYTALGKRQPPTKTTSADYARPLRAQGKAVRVFRNGESPESMTVAIWGNSMHEILMSATSRLRMGFAARVLYRTDGSRVETFEDLAKDELVCASQGEPFVDVADARRKVLTKARWSRDRRLHGKNPLHAILQPTINPSAKVDPLAPSLYVNQDGSKPPNNGITFLTQLPVA